VAVDDLASEYETYGSCWLSMSGVSSYASGMTHWSQGASDATWKGAWGVFGINKQDYKRPSCSDDGLTISAPREVPWQKSYCQEAL